MSTLSIEKSHNPKRAAPRKGSAKSNAAARPKGWSAAADPKKSSNPNKTTTKKTSAKSNPMPRRETTASIAVATAEAPAQAVDTSLGAKQPKLESATKQDRMLTLLSRPEGVTIEEM